MPESGPGIYCPSRTARIKQVIMEVEEQMTGKVGKLRKSISQQFLQQSKWNLN
jgi:hypothetical protein